MELQQGRQEYKFVYEGMEFTAYQQSNEIVVYSPSIFKDRKILCRINITINSANKLICIVNLPLLNKVRHKRKNPSEALIQAARLLLEYKKVFDKEQLEKAKIAEWTDKFFTSSDVIRMVEPVVPIEVLGNIINEGDNDA